jgi:hypothetical protein
VEQASVPANIAHRRRAKIGRVQVMLTIFLNSVLLSESLLFGRSRGYRFGKISA